MSDQTTENLVNQIDALDRKFHRAYRQALSLNNKIADLQARYDRALEVDRKSFRHTLRIQLAITEGMRNMYYEYVCRTGDEMVALHQQLLSEAVLSDSEEDVDMDVDV